MYAAFDRIREMGEGGARVVAGHDPQVAERFGGSPDVIRIAHDERRADVSEGVND